MNTEHVQAKFYSKQEQYAIPDAPFSFASSATPEDLSQLINSVLSETQKAWENVDFDFLIQGEFLREKVQAHIIRRDISTESVLEVEYIERHPAPVPQDSLLHDDWVSAVHTAGEWILTGCYDNTLHIWTTSGEHKQTIPGHGGAVKDVTWLKNGESFVSVSADQTAMLWEWDEASNSIECVHACRGHARSVDCVAANSAGSKFATGSFDKMLKIWSTDADPADSTPHVDDPHAKKRKLESGRTTTNKTPIVTLSGHNEAITAVQWTDELEVCTASWDHTIRLWDLDLGGLKQQLAGTKAFLDVDSCPQTRHLISSSADRHVRLWDPRSTGSAVQTVFTSHNGWVSCVKWSPNNEYHFISGSYDNLLKLWDTRSPKAPLYDMAGHEDKVLCCDWTNPSLMISGGADNHLKLFQARDKV